MKIVIEAEPKEFVETLELLNKSFFVSNPLSNYERAMGFGSQRKTIPEEGHAVGTYTGKCAEREHILPATMGMGQPTMGVGQPTIAGGEEYGK